MMSDDEESNTTRSSIADGAPTTSTPKKSVERPTMPYSPLGVGKSLSPSQRHVQHTAQKVLTRAKKRQMSTGAPGTPSPLKTLKQTKKTRTNWPPEEMKALVEFVAMPNELWNSATAATAWPQMNKHHEYWTEAADYIHQQTGLSRRNESKVYSRVSKTLNHRYPKKKGGIAAAEQDYGISIDSYLSGPAIPPSQASVHNPPLPPATDTPTPKERAPRRLFDVNLTSSSSLSLSDTTVSKADEAKKLNKVDALKKEAAALDEHELLQLTDHLYDQVAQSKGINCITNFASLSATAMERLQDAQKPNIMYKFAQCLAEDRKYSDEPLMPFDRMPFGLIQHQIQFFTTKSGKVDVYPTDFRQWQTMMEVEFGKRFNQLFRGPYWSGAKEETMETARVNVSCVSHNTICADIRKKSGVTTTTEIQIESIRRLKQQQADGRYWIKLDGTDIKAALQESKRGEWNGDVDMRDGKLENIRVEYNGRMHQVENPTKANCDLSIKALKADKNFLTKSLQDASKQYDKEIAKASAKKAKELNWNILECVQLLDRAEACLDVLQRSVKLPHAGLRATITSQKVMLKRYITDLFKKKRTVATHVLVIMASDERRKRKPYATPLQYVPYRTITADDVNRLVANVKEEMVNEGLEVIGVATDGEFNTLRTRGQTRPLHVYQVIQNARRSVATTKKEQLLQMIVKTGESDDGTPTVECPDAVPNEIVDQLDNLRTTQNMSMTEALNVIRQGLVPDGYQPATWRLDAPETQLDALRSLIATFRFRKAIDDFCNDGVNFRRWLYVPEVDPTTGRTIHAREDHNHLLKRIASHTRDGSFHRIDTRRFVEASKIKEANLGEVALKGERKQSVPDAEALLSYDVAKVLAKEGYSSEAEYVNTVAAWHEASDGRGMTQQQRQEANQAMKAYILREWMPWCDAQSPDYRTIDINVRTDKLCGFSRQTIVGVTANIESQEQRRLQNDSLGYEEHPRATHTDDNELFFSLLHWKSRGQHVTLKDFKSYWQKLVLEFGYKMADDLPFYFHTLNERFSKEDKPSFDEPGERPSRLHTSRRRQREDRSSIVTGRSSLPATNSRSARQQNHRPMVGIATPTEEMQDVVQSIVNKYNQDSQS